MASLMKIVNSNKLLFSCANRLHTTVSMSAEELKGLPMLVDKSTALMTEEQKKHLKHLREGHIQTTTPMDISLINGIPIELLKERRVRIFASPKNAMQSGTYNVGQWTMEFDTRERWENPLIGWSSSGDPLSNMALQFYTANDAIAFCEKNGWEWFIDSEHKINARAKAYANNYSWNRRSRVTTK